MQNLINIKSYLNRLLLTDTVTKNYLSNILTYYVEVKVVKLLLLSFAVWKSYVAETGNIFRFAPVNSTFLSLHAVFLFTYRRCHSGSIASTFDRAEVLPGGASPVSAPDTEHRPPAATHRYFNPKQTVI